MKRIFTFWEPREAKPGYLELCLETWRRFLPEYEIVELDYSNLDQWLGRDCFAASLYTNFSLSKQVNALRCAVLRRWGGVWFDADTIVTSGKARALLSQDSDFVLIGTHIAFIAARKDAYVLKKWERRLRLFISFHDFCRRRGFAWRRLERWGTTGNMILNGILRLRTLKQFTSLDSEEIKALPEINHAGEGRPQTPAVKAETWNSRRRFYSGPGFTSRPIKNAWAALRNLFWLAFQRALSPPPLRPGSRPEKYRDFYFEHDFSDYALENSGGLILLHNSWTPENYKTMNREEFLRQNTTLANIFRKLLEA